MKIIENRGGVDRRALQAAVDVIRDGGIVLYPTDTIYALGCDALNNRAIERLCRIKGLNPAKNTLAITCADLSQAAQYARIDNAAFRLLRDYLPGPFTFILPASTALPKAFKGRRTVGIRIPDCDFARAIAAELDSPVMTGTVPVDDEDLLADPRALADSLSGLSDIELCIAQDSGGTEPSTVIDCTDSHNPAVVRQGIGRFDE